MSNSNIKSLTQNATYALVAAMTILASLFAGFFMAEPSISYGQVATSNDFYIRQTITAESSFLVQPTDVTASGTINGVTGGNATGSTQFVVQSNNATGYYVEIDFFDNVGATAMRGDVTGSESLRDYSGDVTGQPSFNFTASTAAQFAYTVISSTTADTDDSFDYNGGSCNQASFDNADGSCWKAPSTSGFQIIDRGLPATSGATSSIQFKIHVPNGAVPVPSAETYTATATLSLFLQ